MNRKGETSLRRLPVRNLMHHPGRSLGLIILVLLLAFSVVTGSLIVGSLQRGLDSLESRLGADVVVVPGQAKTSVDLEQMLIRGTPGYFYMDRGIAEKVAAIEGVEAVSPQVYLASTKASCCSAKIQIIGFDPETDFSVQPWIQRTYRDHLESCDVIIGSDISPSGDGTIRIYDVICRVVGQLEHTGTGLDAALYCNRETIDTLIQASVDKGSNLLLQADPSQVISSVYVKIAEGYDPQTVSDRINLSLRRVDAVPAMSMMSSVSGSLTGISRIITVLIGAVWVLALLVMILVFAMTTRERSREFAVLRMLGARPGILSRLVMSEALIACLIGGVLGAGLGALVVLSFRRAIEQQMGMPFLLPGAETIVAWMGLALIIAMVTGAVTAVWSARRLSQVEAAAALRRE